MTDTLLHSQGCACCGDLLAKRYDRRRFLHVVAGAGMMAALPSFAFAAEGNYEAMLLTCIDPRLPEPTIKYMEGRHMVGRYSQFIFAGASIGVVAPAFKTWSVAFWDNLDPVA
jgi:ABC-type cobalamin transport system permease subunit